MSLDNIVCLVGRNNTGKSTVLRAYELAQGSKVLMDADRCQWSPTDEFPEVELCVHIPDGIANVDSKWKQEQAGMKIVRSRWQWRDSGKPLRQTWDPTANEGTGEWAEDGKAGGADNVFNSRLPQPIRADSLQDAFGEHDDLLKLVVDPIVKELRQLQDSAASPLRAAIQNLVAAAMEPVNQYQENVSRIAARISRSFCEIFPDLNLRINIAMELPNFNASRALLNGSSIMIVDDVAETGIKQQGTGSRRALFWALLQVRNLITEEKKIAAEREKAAAKLRQDLEKEQNKTKPNQSKIETLVAQLQAAAESTAEDQDLSLPGHILLMDEPENCLHPMAVRAAREHLYALSDDPDWQIILSTHSPYFIDPLKDHTTIVRLERNGRRTSPWTFQTATVQFSQNNKEDLRALLQLDSALAEMFFGSYPILVEGDTELAAFIAAIVQESDGLSTRASIVPARGKALIVPLIRLLEHFHIPFGVLHDSDAPRRTDGRGNSAWTENAKIASAIAEARSKGLTVRHRISIPDFERRLGGFEGEKDKPIQAYRLLRTAPELNEEVRVLFNELQSGEREQPFEGIENSASPDVLLAALESEVKSWAAANAQEDSRFVFSDSDGEAANGG